MFKSRFQAALLADDLPHKSGCRKESTPYSPESAQDSTNSKCCRVLVIDSATLPPEARLAVAEVSQTANGLRVKMHDKHGPLVSIGKHLGMFTDQVQVRARFAISDQPMSAEEWKKQYVKEG